MPPVGKEEQPIVDRGMFHTGGVGRNTVTKGRVGEYRVGHRDIEARPRRKYKLWRNSGATMSSCAHDVVGQKTSLGSLKSKSS